LRTKEQIFEQIVLLYLPRYYADFPVVREIMQASAGEYGNLTDTASDLLNQFFIDTATWSISRWEEIYGIKTPANTTLSYDERRAAVKVQMQTKRVMSKKGIKDVFATHNSMEVAVTENNPAYSVDIKFTDMRGVPANLPEIKAQMTSLLPAHIAVTYSYTWFLWAEWDAKGILWADQEAQGLTYAQLEAWQ
jgi:hypothetical protein